MFVNYQVCSACEITTRHSNNYCDTCASEAEKARIKAWESQTTAKKLTDIRERLERLEQGPVRY